jgi:6-pyruvoyltetrahydropterin/6-carboxytetrahydropterin synthase
MSMFETGTATTVRSFHVMPGAPPPEGERHAHDYRIEVVVARHALDDRGMVVDLDVLDAALADLAGVVDGADLDTVTGSGAEAVTVEVFARWAHERLAPAVAAAGAEDLAVRVWESATAFGGYRSSLDGRSA